MLVAVAVIALALLLVGGAQWRKRRARGVPTGDRTAGPIAAEVALAPAPVPVRASAAGRQPRPAPQGAPRPRPRAVAHNGATAQAATAVVAPPPAAGPQPRVRPPAAGPEPRVRALGYVSVPHDRPLEAEAGLQARAIEAVCAARDWAFIGGVREAEPAHGKGLERPGLIHALERLEGGEADCLVVTELARLTRSAAEIGELLDRLGRARVRLVVLDLEIDTHTDSGQLVAKALATVSAWERERLSERTRKGLAAARQRGTHRAPRSQRPTRTGRAHHHHARQRHDPPGHRRRPQHPRRTDGARRRALAALQRPGRTGLQTPTQSPQRHGPHEPAKRKRTTNTTTQPPTPPTPRRAPPPAGDSRARQ